LTDPRVRLVHMIDVDGGQQISVTSS